MEIGRAHISPSALELLQIRAMTFHDATVDLLAILKKDDQDESVAEDSLMAVSAHESVAVLLADIAQSEHWRASMPKAPDWFGPVEQLTLQVADSGTLILDYADELLAEVQRHKTHTPGCRCYELLDVLHERIVPALTEFTNLLDAIKRLRQCRQSQSKATGPDE